MSPVVVFEARFPVDFKIAQCRLSILRNGNVPCRYFSSVSVDLKVVQCRPSNVRKRRVALWNLRVKGPFLSCIGSRQPQLHGSRTTVTLFQLEYPLGTHSKHLYLNPYFIFL